jgi:hypothetical protein
MHDSVLSGVAAVILYACLALHVAIAKALADEWTTLSACPGSHLPTFTLALLFLGTLHLSLIARRVEKSSIGNSTVVNFGVTVWGLVEVHSLACVHSGSLWHLLRAVLWLNMSIYMLGGVGGVAWLWLELREERKASRRPPLSAEVSRPPADPTQLRRADVPDVEAV